jgi:hypothetical protein
MLGRNPLATLTLEMTRVWRVHTRLLQYLLKRTSAKIEALV